MILADTSVWIEFLRGNLGPDVNEDTMFQVLTCGPVIQEVFQVFQGLRPFPESRIFEERFLALPRLCDPLPLRIFTDAATIYRQGRRKGYTIRSQVDCLIAAIAIDNKVAVWHKDRDFDAIARYTGLETFESP
jgi:predicted nucleic acid-binding protein